MQYGSQSNLYFLSWYGFSLNNNPEKIKEYPIQLEENNLNLKDLINPEIKLNKDLDLFSIIIILSAHLQIEDFINGFYCFKSASKNLVKYGKEDPRKKYVEKLKIILERL